MTKLILSLFDRTGNWSQPYRDAGYDVIQIDEQLGWNVYQLHKDNVRELNPHGLLIALPCTDFAVSGAAHFFDKDKDGRTAESIRLARFCLQVVQWCPNLKWWALENPVGRINTLMPEFAQFGPWYFHPYEFGGWCNPPSDNYTKKTGLWGTFNRNLEKREVTINYTTTESGKVRWTSDLHGKLGGKSLKTKNLRSATPKGFAQAFFHANP